MTNKRIKSVFEKSPQYRSAIHVIGLLEAAGFEAFIVGGAVRDALLGRDIHDFDMTTNAKPEDMLKVFKDFKLLKQGVDFGTLGVVIGEASFEITSYRGESDYSDQRHPDSVDFIASKDEDLKRRDFTINAMMFHPERGLYDPLDGVRDLDQKIIRTVGEARRRFEEDSLRILRMLRFSVSLGFSIEDASLKASKEMLESLTSLSKERVFAEMEKTLGKGIHWKDFDGLINEYLSVGIPRIDLGDDLEVFEKAYVISLFTPFFLGLENYVLPKELKKYFNYYVSLGDLSQEDFKTVFVKMLDQNTLRGERASRFWKTVGAFSSVCVNLEALKKHPSAELEKKLSDLKSKLSGAGLGKAILSEKVLEVFG